jgi:ADP-ribose pyrophosphatase
MHQRLLPKVLDTQRIYDGKFLKLRVDTIEMPGTDIVVKREVVEHLGGVCVLPVLGDGRIVFVRQYRHALGGDLLELPAGKLDIPGETAEQAVRRELWEEAGCMAAQWETMGFIYTAPGFTDEKIHLFRAGKVSLSDEDFDNEEEGTQVVVLRWEQVMEKLVRGELTDAKTMALLALEMSRRV